LNREIIISLCYAEEIFLSEISPSQITNSRYYIKSIDCIYRIHR
jgi:hypothetical protein